VGGSSTAGLFFWPFEEKLKGKKLKLKKNSKFDGKSESTERGLLTLASFKTIFDSLKQNQVWKLYEATMLLNADM